MSKRELPSLECSVTLLTDFEPVSDPMDWQLGTHGLRISFTASGRRYGATYLPDVAREQGWTKDETIVSLMRKAGWGGHKSEWRKVPDLKVTRYQGKKSSLTYSEWRDWRDWVVENGQESEFDG
jgi:AMMECR1 domain-containing protein